MVNLEEIKLPPHNTEAEKGLLSSVLLDNEVFYSVESMYIHGEDFYHKEHKSIYNAMNELWEEQKNIDVVTLSNKLTSHQQLENVGGVDYLYEISSFVISPTVSTDYAKIVKEKSILRNILKACQHISGEVYEERDAADILDTVEKKIFDLTQVNLSNSMRHIKDILNTRVENYMDIVDNPEKIDEGKVMSQYGHLDNLLGGFKPGDLVILAARPSMGKTAFALNVLSNAAVKQDKTVAFFSLEMGNEQIVDRVLSNISEIPMYKIHKGKLDEDDFSNIGDAMEKIGETKIYLDDIGGATVPEMKSKLRRLRVEKGGLDLVIVDYLQLMSTNSSRFNGNRVLEISEISRGLKQLSRELQVPIIALSQLSRAVEQRPDKKPNLSDLRESGAIEQDADAVIMLYREDYYDVDTDRKGMADLFLRKNRNGPVGDVELVFVDNIMKFYEKSNEQGEEEGH